MLDHPVSTFYHPGQVNVYDSKFNIHPGNTKSEVELSTPGIAELRERISMAAFHDSKERAGEVNQQTVADIVHEWNSRLRSTSISSTSTTIASSSSSSAAATHPPSNPTTLISAITTTHTHEDVLKDIFNWLYDRSSHSLIMWVHDERRDQTSLLGQVVAEVLHDRQSPPIDSEEPNVGTRFIVIHGLEDLGDDDDDFQRSFLHAISQGLRRLKSGNYPHKLLILGRHTNHLHNRLFGSRTQSLVLRRPIVADAQRKTEKGEVEGRKEMKQKGGQENDKLEDNRRYSHASHDTSGMSNHPNIIVFGQTGAGKSSLINMLAGKSIMQLSSGATGCTTTWKSTKILKDSADGTERTYIFWDTPGLNEGEHGNVPAEKAMDELCDLVRRLPSVNLIIYCVLGSRFTNIVQVNYDLFYGIACKNKNVPIVLVVSGLENEEYMDDWLENQKKAIKWKGMMGAFRGYACVTTTKGKGNMYLKKYQDSALKVWALVEQHCKEPWKITLRKREEVRNEMEKYMKKYNNRSWLSRFFSWFG